MIDENKLIEKRTYYPYPASDYEAGWNDCNRDWMVRIWEQPQVGGWIPVSERLPKVEEEVFVQMCRNGHIIATTAIYEDGKMSTEDSIWNWYDLEFDYDEENDVYLIPEGWWEYRHYNPDDVYNNIIDDIVVAWQPLPELFKESEGK